MSQSSYMQRTYSSWRLEWTGPRTRKTQEKGRKLWNYGGPMRFLPFCHRLSWVRMKSAEQEEPITRTNRGTHKILLVCHLLSICFHLTCVFVAHVRASLRWKVMYEKHNNVHTLELFSARGDSFIAMTNPVERHWMLCSFFYCILFIVSCRCCRLCVIFLFVHTYSFFVGDVSLYWHRWKWNMSTREITE